MRIYVCWVFLLLFTGCQTTQPLGQATASEPERSQRPEHTEKVAATLSTSIQTAAAKQKEQVKTPTPQEQTDLWQRISMQFRLTVPNEKSVNRYRSWYLRHPGHLEIVAQRATPFLYLITEKIEQRHLPLELALLPVVESSFDAFAYSYGRAAGLWQFVPSTGKLYGLKQNFWYDGRRDVDAATDAALDYLTYLNKKFDGNWYHAIAAYNSGSGRVSSAIRKNKRKGLPTDFFSLDLPKETSSYVPKLLALADVIAHQQQYGIELPPIDNQPVLARVNPQKQLDLALAAKYANISVRELQSYNPAFNQWATSPNGPYQLLIPVNKVEIFEQSVEDDDGQGVKLVRYQVKSGDVLGKIAKKYNTTMKVIQTVNNLDGMLIRAGQYLMIPTSVKDEKAYTLSMRNRLAKIQSRVRGQYKMTHQVSSGESLWSIAQDYHVSHTSLAKWNGMSPRDPLRVGRKLVVWKDASDGAIIRTLLYKVRSGDTLSGIASKFRLKTSDIVKWNSLLKGEYLQPGQQLKLYVDVTKVSV
ncbi:LysM peptidoglycan-binding domain-containing protein [Vibrio mangrovi]|uniref:LysM peptidoglycan-binding domain-containing protein n=1 Tax=Vibrio mangrovi TaxID=474394 RepID=A0A1Y6IRV8_9VIBR|nr:LysM peptidoglycan-binding domain-containing protein [Vibrio mangrovi]MDW6001607.1 LysM peptidoglycan-binding domain-containing protein [Vibrio mangrovi]SMS00366.1 Membrane-bound lytic murein transglycosylase D precursor [Vibrio mangrovi]